MITSSTFIARSVMKTALGTEKAIAGCSERLLPIAAAKNSDVEGGFGGGVAGARQDQQPEEKSAFVRVTHVSS